MTHLKNGNEAMETIFEFNHLKEQMTMSFAFL